MNKHLLLALVSIVLSFVCVVNGKPQVTFSKMSRNIHIEFPLHKKGDVQYFKIDETVPFIPTNLIQASFEACLGRIAIYVKQCNPNKGVCDDSITWIPSSSNHHFAIGQGDEASYFQLPLTRLCSQITHMDEGVCSASLVYYVAVVSLQDVVQASAVLRAYTVMGMQYYSMKKTLGVQPLTVNSTQLIWERATYCKTIDPVTFECKEKVGVENAKYRLVYVPADTKTNIGTICGMQQNFTETRNLDNSTSVQFTSSHMKTYFGLSVLIEPNHQSDLAEYLYTPVVMTPGGKIHSDHNIRQKTRGKRILGTLFLTAFLIVLVVVLGAIAVVSGYWAFKRYKRNQEINQAFLDTKFLE